ncbi:unnamed protein product [Discosporangium mesarthrocarpum]
MSTSTTSPPGRLLPEALANDVNGAAVGTVPESTDVPRALGQPRTFGGQYDRNASMDELSTRNTYSWSPQASPAGAIRLALADATNATGEGLPSAKKRKNESKKGEGVEVSDRCTICLEEWTSEGRHRVSTLPCGHLFGRECIERWLKEKPKCPQCGMKVSPKAKVRGVIPLFVPRRLVARDNGILEHTTKLLEHEKRLRKQVESERVRLSIDNESLRDEVRRVTKALAAAEAAATAAAAWPRGCGRIKIKCRGTPRTGPGEGISRSGEGISRSGEGISRSREGVSWAGAEKEVTWLCGGGWGTSNGRGRLRSRGRASGSRK